MLSLKKRRTERFCLYFYQKYYLKELCTFEEINKQEGNFFDESHFDLIINHDADVYRIDKDGNKHIMFYCRKNRIPDKYLKMPLIFSKKTL